MARTQTAHAMAAKAIRAELKKEFPEHKARVRSTSFSMGNAVDIYIGGKSQTVDGFQIDKNCPNHQLREKVRKVVAKYQSGSFDGMEDIYNYDNRRDDIPQVKYVHVNADY